MDNLDIIRQRLHNERLAGRPCERPEDVVRWLCAVQAQDYAGAKWAIAQRTTDVTDAALDRLFNDGKILRTHVLRPTWHLVTPQDIRWMLGLTAPRVNAANAYQYRQLELDDAVFARSNDALVKALQGGAQLTRTEIARAYEEAGIRASGLRLAYLLMRAELDAIVCSGPLRGKQFTYALLDERAPRAKELRYDEALAELARRYLASHGPALVKDFAWWSGLTLKEARAGIETAKAHLQHEAVGGKVYWFAAGQAACGEIETPLVHLLPNYDEYVIAYKDHSATLDPALSSRGGDALMAHLVVLDGRVVGGWRRAIQRKAGTVTMNLPLRLKKSEKAALQRAVERYGRFLGVPVAIAS
ncbi:winged helix DNA-binding domain-containing protein [Sorangium sp. So ce1153]|uniref:winged helix DNA-binding domain-containing protein n=1 Tax=Sorangium sp. So ce1153 TaxID=3133333 RepID=UPI003F634692